jgi:1,2-phenylacetyl-CoA epoxidase catalytic subunit
MDSRIESVGEIMERLGFKEDADDRVKAAFIKNLVKQAYNVDVTIPEKYEQKIDEPKYEQLSFNIDKIG